MPLVPRARAWLIDLYETTFRVDLRAVMSGLAEIAELDVDAFREALAPLSPRLTVGALGWREVFSAVVEDLGGTPDPDLVDRLLAADRRLLLEHTTVFDDAAALLHRLRAAGARTAFVSNCAEHTRELLVDLGLDGLVDALVLSNEVGASKPDPRIYQEACAHLGVEPADAVLVDDQAAYCAGALGAGLSAIRIRRSGELDDAASWPVHRTLDTVVVQLRAHSSAVDTPGDHVP